VRGKVIKITEEGARAHIDRLAKKYLGKEMFPGDPSEVRVMYFVQPEAFSAMG
jgi:hypothetical protein